MERYCEICDRDIAVEELATLFSDLWICPHCWDERPDEVDFDDCAA